MYKISVPVTNKNVIRCTPEKVHGEIKKFDPDRIFISIDRYLQDENEKKSVLEGLRENCLFFKSKGYEVGAWIWAFMLNNNPYSCITSLKGTKFPENCCPADEDFLNFAVSFIEDVAKTGVDIIMFDDDLRYGFLGDAPGCTCKHHMKMISDIVGEDVSPEKLREYVYNGGSNKYRDAYLKANGDAFRNFAKRMRETVDKVNPDIRMGACSCMTSWDIDGVSAGELAKIFAGRTKPFVRLIGAPYWAAVRGWGNSLQDVIELSRMECSWTDDGNIEIFSEGDVYPRPRTNCPAAYLEGFDTALRAAGCTDGILKYGMDYVSDADYETGYSAYHIRNRELYKQIEAVFGNKTSAGVRVYEYPEKLRYANFSEEENIENLFFSYASRTLAYNTVPTVWEGEGITGAVFGENARHIPLSALKNGLIIDIFAAKILSERGIDTGTEIFGDKINSGAYEIFTHNNNRISAMNVSLFDITLQSNAEILSFTEKEGREIPISYYYENENGQKFLVFNACYTIDNPNIFRHYERSRQLSQGVKKLSGKELPAAVSGHPALYMQCKENENSLAVGLWNFYADIAFSPEITLSEKYTEIKFVNCEGTLSDKKLTLSDIPAFGFCAVELKK